MLKAVVRTLFPVFVLLVALSSTGAECGSSGCGEAGCTGGCGGRWTELRDGPAGEEAGRSALVSEAGRSCRDRQERISGSADRRTCSKPKEPGATNPLILHAYTFIPKNLDRSKKQPLIVFRTPGRACEPGYGDRCAPGAGAGPAGVHGGGDGLPRQHRVWPGVL